MKTIYLCDDEASVRDGVCQYLKLEGYEARGFETLSETQHAISTCEPDLLIQEVTLPDGNGFSFVKKLKASYSFPIVFLTARASESDRIIGFELGADDYIVKPFSPKELVLRIKALFRRIELKTAKRSGGSVYVNSNNILKFDSVAHVLTVDGMAIQLTAAEWRVLEYLISADGQLENRAQMIQNCFDYSNDGYEGIINTHIKNLRSKITGSWIETIRGYGYRFLGVRNKDARNKDERYFNKANRKRFAGGSRPQDGSDSQNGSHPQNGSDSREGSRPQKQKKGALLPQSPLRIPNYRDN